MGELFGSIFWLLVTLGLLVTFHEYGHYWVGRRCGVKVLRFSVGFGRPIWSRYDRSGTEFAIAPIPLGGYVKFLDEREDEVAPTERHLAFNNKSIGQRMAIVAAGPAANLLFALLAFWAMYLVGKQDFAPVIGHADGIAAEAGLRAGDRMLTVDGQTIENWTHAALPLITAGLDRRSIAVEVADANGDQRRIALDLSRLPAGTREPDMLFATGIVPRHRVAPARVGSIAAGSPAEAVGLQLNDLILAIDGEPIRHWTQLSPPLQAAGEQGSEAMLRIERDGRILELALAPALTDRGDGTMFYAAGIGPARYVYDYDALLRYGPIEAIGASARETWTMTTATLGMLWRMVAGRASLENLSGPITISQYANASARSGLGHFLWFLGVISLSLCIINLLPIPILDGGHLLYYLIELVKGSPVSERAVAAGHYIGFLALIGLMGLAFYNDIARLFS